MNLNGRTGLRRGSRAGPRRWLSLLLGTMLVGACLALSLPANADPAMGAVLILAPEHDASSQRYRDLESAIRARLAAFHLDVRLYPLREDLLPDEDLARSLAQSQKALTVAWLAQDAGEFHFLSPELDQEPRVRTLDSATRGWLSLCEVMAAMLHAELKQVLVSTAYSRENPTPTPVPEAAPEPAGDRHGTGDLHISAGLATGLLDQPRILLHAVHLGLGFRIGKVSNGGVSADLGQSVPLGIPGSTTSLWHIPLRFSLGTALETQGILLSVKLGPTVELWKLHGLDYVLAQPITQELQADPGLHGLVCLQGQVRPRLAAFVLLGADLFFSERVATLYGETLMRRAVLQPFLCLGVSIPILPP